MIKCYVHLPDGIATLVAWVRSAPRIGEQVAFGGYPETYRVVMVTHNMEASGRVESDHPYHLDISVSLLASDDDDIAELVSF